MATVFLTHDPNALRVFYGEPALAALREIAEVRLNPAGRLLSTDELVREAAGCELDTSTNRFSGVMATPRMASGRRRSGAGAG